MTDLLVRDPIFRDGVVDIELTILMPCLDEAETVDACVRSAHRYLARRGVSGEVLVADNGSTDGSRMLAATAGARVIAVTDRGYGAALRAGIGAARGRFVVMADADGSYDFQGIDPFLAALRSGADLVMGNRFRGGIAPGAMPALHRYLGNPVLSSIGRRFFRAPVGDFHCGMRGFRRDAIIDLHLRTSGMEFASEMVVKSQLAGLRITEVPTTLRPDGRSRPPHLNSWRDGWRHLRFLLLYSPRWLLLYPGLLLMVGGGAALAWGATDSRASAAGLDLQTMLYASGFLVVGYVVVAFAVVAKTFAVTEGLLPPDSNLERMYRWVHLETGLCAGFAMIITGLCGSGWSLVHHWGSDALLRHMQVVIPSVTLTMLGIETVVVSFMLSLMGLRRAGSPAVSVLASR